MDRKVFNAIEDMSTRSECRSRPQAGCQQVKYVRAKSPWLELDQTFWVSVSDEQADDESCRLILSGTPVG